MHKNKDFGFFDIYIYIYNIYSVIQNGSSALSPGHNSAGQLLLSPPVNRAAWPASLPSLYKPHCSPSSSLSQASTGRNGRLAWKIKGDCFAHCYILYSSKCALNADSSSDTPASLFPETCKGLRAVKRQRLLDSSSLAAERSSPGVLSSLDTAPHCTLSLDSLLGNFGISKKCTDQESKVTFAPLPKYRKRHVAETV